MNAKAVSQTRPDLQVALLCRASFHISPFQIIHRHAEEML